MKLQLWRSGEREVSPFIAITLRSTLTQSVEPVKVPFAGQMDLFVNYLY